MEVVHLNQKQLAVRWCISEATLERWRSAGIGPKFLKLCGRVLSIKQATLCKQETTGTSGTKVRASGGPLL